MGLSKSSAEGRRKELKIFRRVLLGSAIAAVGLHLSSVPLIMRFVNNAFGDLALEPIAEPIAVILLEEESPELAAPPTDTAIDNEPSAAADESTAPPLETAAAIAPTPPTAESIDTVPTGSALASDEGAPDGRGAAGDGNAIGLIPGSGSSQIIPTRPFPPNISAVPQGPVPTRRDGSPQQAQGVRTIACAPCTLPEYPESQRRRSQEGLTVISVVFDPDGNIVTAEIEASSGNPALDNATLRAALEDWRFQDSSGLGGRVSVNVVFVIEGSAQYEVVQSEGPRRSVQLPVEQGNTPPPTGATAANQSAESSRSPAPVAAPPTASADPAPSAAPTPPTATPPTPSQPPAAARPPQKPRTPVTLVPQPVPQAAAPTAPPAAQ